MSLWAGEVNAATASAWPKAVATRSMSASDPVTKVVPAATTGSPPIVKLLFNVQKLHEEHLPP